MSRPKRILIFAILVSSILLSISLTSCSSVGTLVGPNGGEVIAAGGVTVTIPSGALEEDQLITIKTLTSDDLPLPIPDNTFLLGGVRVEPSLVFSKPVTITVPLSTSFPLDTPLPVLIFDSVTNQYKFETEALVNGTGNSATFNVSHFSDYVIPGATVDQTDQLSLKNQIKTEISEFLEQHEGRYFYDEGFLSLGDISKVTDRLYDDDIQVHIYPEYLEDLGAIAAYVDYDIWVHGWKPILFFNDIVIAAQPSEVDRVTLYHEVMHAIHDEHDGELKANGVPDDEALTWFMEQTSDYIEFHLVPVDEEFGKYLEGLPYDRDTIELRLRVFVSSLEEYKKDPGAIAGSGPGTLPALTSEALAFEKQLTGLDVDPVSIKARYENLLPGVVNSLITAGCYHTVGLKSDGTVVAVGRNDDGQRDLGDWTSITQISAGSFHTVGLEDDGTVVAVGRNNYGQCNVTGWADIEQIAAGNVHTVGLRSDGTVVAVGSNTYGQCNVDGWTDIIQVGAGYWHTLGLKADGTVVSAGWNNCGQRNVDDWTGIIQIAGGGWHTVGLRSGGTVVAVGKNTTEQCDVGDWTGIIQVAAGYFHTLGLEADDTVIAVGWDKYGECAVGSWTDVTQIAAGCWYTVGLKEDGTVVAMGQNDDGQCNVSGWDLN